MLSEVVVAHTRQRWTDGGGGVFVREGRRSRVNSIVGGTRRLLGSVPGHSWIQLFCHVEVVDYAGVS